MGQSLPDQDTHCNGAERPVEAHAAQDEEDAARLLVIARQVNRWTADPTILKLFHGWVDRAGQLHSGALKRWRELCHQRVRAALEQGIPMEAGTADWRGSYRIAGLIPRGLAEELLDTEAKSCRIDLGRDRAAAWLAVLHKPDLNFWEPPCEGAAECEACVRRRKTLADSGEYVKLETMVCIPLPERPTSPLLLTGEGVSALLRDDYIALAATRLLALHDSLIDEDPRLPHTSSDVFDFDLGAAADELSPELAGSFLNSVEAVLKRRGLLGREVGRSRARVGAEPGELRTGMSAKEADPRAAELIKRQGWPGSLRKLAAALAKKGMHCSHETLRQCESVKPHFETKQRAPQVEASGRAGGLVVDPNLGPLEGMALREELEAMLKELPPDQRRQVEGQTPQKQRDLVETWQAQKREEAEDSRPKYTRRRPRV